MDTIYQFALEYLIEQQCHLIELFINSITDTCYNELMAYTSNGWLVQSVILLCFDSKNYFKKKTYQFRFNQIAILMMSSS